MAEIIKVNKIVRHENVKDDLSGGNYRKKTKSCRMFTVHAAKFVLLGVQ